MRYKLFIPVQVVLAIPLILGVVVLFLSSSLSADGRFVITVKLPILAGYLIFSTCLLTAVLLSRHNAK